MKAHQVSGIGIHLFAMGALLLAACTAEPVQEPEQTPAAEADTTTAGEATAAEAAPVEETEAPATPCETEEEAPAPVAAEKIWTVGLVSFKTEANAKKAMEALVAKGYAAEIFLVNIDGKPWYRVAVSGFKSKPDARKFRDAARAMGYKTAWLVSPA